MKSKNFTVKIYGTQCIYLKIIHNNGDFILSKKNTDDNPNDKIMLNQFN